MARIPPKRGYVPRPWHWNITTPNALTAPQMNALYPGQMMKPVEIARCKSCGAAFPAETFHSCPELSENDLAAVRTIRELSAAGLSPQEIADDMGIVMGWRAWAPWPDGITGIRIGTDVTWPTDRPCVAVCADTGCCGRALACHAWNPDAPSCRIHALVVNDERARLICGPVMRIGNESWEGVFPARGYVALWGEVITGADGYLATRAYPLAIAHEQAAKDYGVLYLKE